MRSILDYGSGKGVNYTARGITVDAERAGSVREYWGVQTVTCYDPGYSPYSELPTSNCDGVICTDVLEHIPESDLPWILEEQFRFANNFVFGNIASYPAEKSLPNGENAHCTVRPAEWWRDLIDKSRTASGSSADYLYIVETKVRTKAWAGLVSKTENRVEYVTNRGDWLGKVRGSSKRKYRRL